MATAAERMKSIRDQRRALALRELRLMMLNHHADRNAGFSGNLGPERYKRIASAIPSDGR